MNYPILEALKKHNAHFSDEQFISLNPDSAFGNLNLNWMQIVIRIDCVNSQIIELYDNFYAMKEQREKGPVMRNLDEGHKDIMITEQIFYWLRKTADEIISLISLSMYFRKHGKFPSKIKVNSIGDFLNLKNSFDIEIDKHKFLLQQLNQISNTFKHSFINPQIMAYKGSEYPVVFAYELRYNDLKNPANFISINFQEFLENFNAFLLDAKIYINQNFKV